MLIFSYSDSLFSNSYYGKRNNVKANEIRGLFETSRKEGFYNDKLYFAGLYYSIVTKLSARDRLYCNFCESRLPVANIRSLRGAYAWCKRSIHNCEDWEDDYWRRSMSDMDNRPDYVVIVADRLGDYKNGIYTSSGFVSHDCCNIWGF